MPRVLLLSELHPALDEFVAGAGLVGVLPDAGDAIGEPEIAEQARQHLRRAGAHLVDVDLDGDVRAQLRKLDVLVATGGDPAALAARLRRTGGGKDIKDAVEAGELHYAGLSAGSMVAGPSLAAHVDAEPDELPPGPALEGLALTDIVVLVHHGRRGRDALHARALARHGATTTLVPLADADGILVLGGVPRLFGPQRGSRKRSALPQDLEALTRLAPHVDWPERLRHPGTILDTVNGEVQSVDTD